MPVVESRLTRSTGATKKPQLAKKPQLTLTILKSVAARVGLNKKYPIGLFKKAMLIELEHGKRSKQTNITNDNLITTGKIVLAHILEIPDYYERLIKMEAKAEKYWKQN